MIRDYQIVSPSLDGILRHECVEYEGLRRPADIMRILDGPAGKGAYGKRDVRDEKDRKVIEDYFHDLYAIFMKRLAHFLVESESSDEDTVKLQAMLQEMIKVKRFVGRGKVVEES
ncbi:hypothetical protein EPO05_06765 [Patescibacteria group bacterium]|nr:MAG: hypothetical protein EPO05_06765 [Patescibacteria group bacterium]